MSFKVLVEEKKPKPPIQEPPKKVPAKPDVPIKVSEAEPPKKGINSLFVCWANFCYVCFFINLPDSSEEHMALLWVLFMLLSISCNIIGFECISLLAPVHCLCFVMWVS